MRNDSRLDLGRTPSRPGAWVPRPIQASLDRLERITVCTRPFRAQGPRIEVESIAGKRVVHNYGHGGSGWSLSWGSAALVVPMAMSGGVSEVRVLGCGALGLTAALALQRAGVRVRIFARDLPPAVRSSRATGLWSPDSRVGLAAGMDEAATNRWERMARESWATYQQLLTLPGRPIGLHSRYLLSELPPEEELAARYREDPVGFVHLDHRLKDLYAAPVDRGPGEHPFASAYSREIRLLRFNITAYSQGLLQEFFERGGEVERGELHSARELGRFAEEAIVNCTGFGAAALFGDESLTPVRGQIAWLSPQPELDYSLQSGKLSVVPRGDGIAVQIGASSDATGWNDADEQADMAEAEHAIGWLARLTAEVR